MHDFCGLEIDNDNNEHKNSKRILIMRKFNLVFDIKTKIDNIKS